MNPLLVLALVQFEEGYFPEVVAWHHDGHLLLLTAFFLRKQNLTNTHTHTHTRTRTHTYTKQTTSKQATNKQTT